MVEHWFPIPVSYNFADNETKNLIFNEYVKSQQLIEDNLLENTWSDNVSTTFESGFDLIPKYNLKTLEHFILNSTKELAEKPLKIKESWINYYKKNNYQDYHRHGASGISGVYYIKTNEQDGRLRLHSPYPIFESGDQYIFHTPKEGKLILFPSWLGHSVEMNKTDSTRISIAFNLSIS